MPVVNTLVGVFIWFANPKSGWQFRETDSGKLLFGGSVFRKATANVGDDGFKYYDVEVEDVVVWL